MDEQRKRIIYKNRKDKLRARMPLVVLIIIFFLLYNFWMPASIFKWLSISALAVYLGVGFYYQKKLRNLLDDFSDNNENKEIE